MSLHSSYHVKYINQSEPKLNGPVKYAGHLEHLQPV